MTVIVYRDGIMAADSRAWSGDHAPIGEKAKIRRLDDGTLMGCSSSSVGGGEYVMDWYAAGRDLEAKLPACFSLLVVHPDGEAFLADDGPYVSGPLKAPFFAIGSGRKYALGALEAGKPAVGAVVIACRLDLFSDLPVTTITHK